MLEEDEVLRREVIFKILCDSSLNYRQIESKYRISFADYFRTELAFLATFKQRGVLEFKKASFNLTPVGQFLGRHVAKVFDVFLQNSDKVYQITGP